jgi:hypothetical protein
LLVLYYWLGSFETDFSKIFCSSNFSISLSFFSFLYFFLVLHY